jgi:hypothetical protein
MADAFYERLGHDRYRSTALTTGPWDRTAQHAGPPSALLGRTLEDALEGPLARITLDILRPVPVAELTVAAAVVRPGRSVRLAEGTLSDDRGPVLVARAWAIRRSELDLPDEVRDRRGPPPPPETGTTKPFFVTDAEVGYHTAMDVRFLAGGFLEPGPARVWMRPRVPLVAGEPLRPLDRVLAAADSGNGVSAWFHAGSWLFVNTDLTVHLHRYPEGEWIHLDAHTTLEPHGVGLARSELSDAAGPIGNALQSLLVGRRDG